MTELRDTRRPLEYWNRRLQSRNEKIHSADRVGLYHEGLASGEEVAKMVRTLKHLYTSYYLEDVTYRYCRGDDLDDIKAQVIDESMDRFIFTCDEIEKHRDKLDKPFWQDLLFYPNDVHSVYSMLSWFILFEADPAKLGYIAPYIAQAGKDRLVDTILQRCQPDREVATEDKCGRTFKLLQSVMDVDENKAIKNLEKYLASWGKLMGTLKSLSTIGTFIPRGAKSNETLLAIDLEEQNDNYIGFWAWEVALVVRVFGIDDSSFCDHEFYPKDLANYKPGA